MNTRRVQCDIPRTRRTPQNTNIAGGRGHGRNPTLGRRTFIDDLVSITNFSIGAFHQGSSVRRSPIIPRVEASVSTVENVGGAATPLGVPAEEDRVSVVGAGDRDVVYHINRKEVKKEECT